MRNTKSMCTFLKIILLIITSEIMQPNTHMQLNTYTFCYAICMCTGGYTNPGARVVTVQEALTSMVHKQNTDMHTQTSVKAAPGCSADNNAHNDGTIVRLCWHLSWICLHAWLHTTYGWDTLLWYTCCAVFGCAMYTVTKVCYPLELGDFQHMLIAQWKTQNLCALLENHLAHVYRTVQYASAREYVCTGASI